MGSLYTELRKEHLKTWRIWYVMNQRCNPEWRKRYLRNDNTFYDICRDWSREESGEEGFINFVNDVGDLEHVSDLHRKNPNLAYSPSNIVRGDTYSRARISRTANTRSARGLQRAIANGIPKWSYYKRLKEGWSIKRASTKPHPYRNKS